MNKSPGSSQTNDSNENENSSYKLLQFSNDIERYKFSRSPIDIVRSIDGVARYLNQSPEVLMALCQSKSTQNLKYYEGEILASAFLIGIKRALTFSKEFVFCLTKIIPSLSLHLRLKTLLELWKITRSSPQIRDSALTLAIRSLDGGSLEHIKEIAKISRDNKAELITKLAIELAMGKPIPFELLNPLAPQEFFLTLNNFPEIVFLPPECYDEPEVTARWIAKNIEHVDYLDDRIILSITKTLDFWNKFPEETMLIACPLYAHAVRSKSWHFLSQFLFGVIFKSDKSFFDVNLKKLGLNKDNLSPATANILKTHNLLLNEPTHDELARYLAYATDNVPPPQDSVEFHGTLWGSDFYFFTAEKLGIRSLLISDSVRRLSKQRKITIAIHTTEESKSKVENLARKFDLSFISFKVFVTLGKHDANAISFRGLALLLALRSTAVNGAVLVPFAPDGFYGEGLDKLVEKCPKGGGSWGLTLRCSVYNLIDFFSNNNFSLESIPEDRRNSLLITLGLEKGYHPVQQFMFNNILSNKGIKQHDSNYTFNTNRNLCWALRLEPKQSVDYIRMSRFRYSNNYFDNLSQPFDHELSSYFSSKGSLYIPDDISDFVFLEFSSDSGYSNYLKGIDSNFPDIPNNNYISVPVSNSLAVKIIQILDSFRFHGNSDLFSPTSNVNL